MTQLSQQPAKSMQVAQLDNFLDKYSSEPAILYNPANGLARNFSTLKEALVELERNKRSILHVHTIQVEGKEVTYLDFAGNNEKFLIIGNKNPFRAVTYSAKGLINVPLNRPTNLGGSLSLGVNLPIANGTTANINGEIETHNGKIEGHGEAVIERYVGQNTRLNGGVNIKFEEELKIVPKVGVTYGSGKSYYNATVFATEKGLTPSVTAGYQSTNFSGRASITTDPNIIAAARLRLKDNLSVGATYTLNPERVEQLGLHGDRAVELSLALNKRSSLSLRANEENISLRYEHGFLGGAHNHSAGLNAEIPHLEPQPPKPIEIKQRKIELLDSNGDSLKRGAATDISQIRLRTDEGECKIYLRKSSSGDNQEPEVVCDFGNGKLVLGGDEAQRVLAELKKFNIKY
jgi:hypothetical protein